MKTSDFKNTLKETEDCALAEGRERIADTYIVELLSGMTVISTSSTSRKLTRGADLSDILDFEVSDALRKYLLSYGEQPIVIPTLVGSALILPQLFSSSRIFGVVFFKKEKKGALLRIASSDTFEGRVGVLDEAKIGKVRKWDEPLSRDLDTVLGIAADILERSEITSFDSQDMLSQRMSELFGLLSRAVDISVELDIEDGILADDCFDRKLFVAFVLIMLQLARSLRSASVNARIYQKDFGLSVAFSFECAKPLSRVSSREIAHFNAISDANNMIFECSSVGGKLELAFTPCRKDWSLLELKFPSDLIL